MALGIAESGGAYLWGYLFAKTKGVVHGKGCGDFGVAPRVWLSGRLGLASETARCGK